MSHLAKRWPCPRGPAETVGARSSSSSIHKTVVHVQQTKCRTSLPLGQVQLARPPVAHLGALQRLRAVGQHGHAAPAGAAVGLDARPPVDAQAGDVVAEAAVLHRTAGTAGGAGGHTPSQAGPTRVQATAYRQPREPHMHCKARHSLQERLRCHLPSAAEEHGPSGALEMGGSHPPAPRCS